jgi:hypothetical protein
MNDDDLKQAESSIESPNLSERQGDSNAVIEVLPPIMRQVPHTRDHQRDEQLALQIRDLARLGLSKASTSLAARVSTYILEKYYLEEFLEGQAEMQRGLASVAVAEAMNGNTPILLHLLKTKLGWSEQHQIEISGEVRSVVSAKPLSKEEFIQKYLSPEDSEE